MLPSLKPFACFLLNRKRVDKMFSFPPRGPIFPGFFVLFVFLQDWGRRWRRADRQQPLCIATTATGSRPTQVCIHVMLVKRADVVVMIQRVAAVAVVFGVCGRGGEGASCPTTGGTRFFSRGYPLFGVENARSRTNKITDFTWSRCWDL